MKFYYPIVQRDLSINPNGFGSKQFIQAMLLKPRLTNEICDNT